MAEPIAPVDVLLYSDNATTRAEVMAAVGRRAGKGLPEIRWDETATAEIAFEKAAAHEYAFMILDGEATKTGGMAVAKQLKQEVFNCPPLVLLIARPQDAWLAHWSEADRVLEYPLNPRAVQETVADIVAATTPR